MSGKIFLWIGFLIIAFKAIFTPGKENSPSSIYLESPANPYSTFDNTTEDTRPTSHLSPAALSGDKSENFETIRALIPSIVPKLFPSHDLVSYKLISLTLPEETSNGFAKVMLEFQRLNVSGYVSFELDLQYPSVYPKNISFTKKSEEAFQNEEDEENAEDSSAKLSTRIIDEEKNDFHAFKNKVDAPESIFTSSLTEKFPAVQREKAEDESSENISLDSENSTSASDLPFLTEEDRSTLHKSKKKDSLPQPPYAHSQLFSTQKNVPYVAVRWSASDESSPALPTLKKAIPFAKAQTTVNQTIKRKNFEPSLSRRVLYTEEPWYCVIGPHPPDYLKGNSQQPLKSNAILRVQTPRVTLPKKYKFDPVKATEHVQRRIEEFEEKVADFFEKINSSSPQIKAWMTWREASALLACFRAKAAKLKSAEAELKISKEENLLQKVSAQLQKQELEIDRQFERQQQLEKPVLEGFLVGRKKKEAKLLYYAWKTNEELKRLVPAELALKAAYLPHVPGFICDIPFSKSKELPIIN